MEDQQFDIRQNLCESSCFKAVNLLLENSKKKAVFEEFILFILFLIIILILVFNTTFNRKESTETIKTKNELIESLKESLKLSKDNRKLWDINKLAMTTRIDLLLSQQATANENMIERDNEIIRLKSKIDRNEVEIKENIKIIDVMKHGIKALEDTVFRLNSNLNELKEEILQLFRTDIYKTCSTNEIQKCIKNLNICNYSDIETKTFKIKFSECIHAQFIYKDTITKEMNNLKKKTNGGSLKNMPITK